MRKKGTTRESALAAAVQSGRAAFILQIRATGLLSRYRDLVTVHLREPCALDQEALRFSPFRAGQGLLPVGVIHSLRRATYLASQIVRPAQAAGRDAASRAAQNG